MAIDSISILTALWQELNSQGVRYCLLRGADRLDPPAGDVDILVDEVDIDRFHDIAGGVGFALKRRWAQDTQHHLVGLDGDHQVVLHAVTEVGFGYPDLPWRIDSAAAMIDRAVAGAGTEPALASLPDEFWVTVYHCLLDKPGIAEHHRVRLQALVSYAHHDDPMAGHLAMGLPQAILTSTLAADWVEVEGRAREVQRALRHLQPIAGRLRHWRRFVELRARKVAERFTGKGVSVALLGPDGAGKSTLVEKLIGRLPVRCHRSYLGLYSQTESPRRMSLPGIALGRRMLRMWQKWAIALIHKRHGRVVIFDRHPIDALLPRLSLRARDRVRRNLLGHSVPAPDLALILDAPGAVLHYRSGEHDAESLERMRQGYLTIATRLPEAVVIDVSRPLEEVASEAVEVVWARYLRRNRARGRP